MAIQFMGIQSLPLKDAKNFGCDRWRSKLLLRHHLKTQQRIHVYEPTGVAEYL